jgi:hypothetical protein
MVLSTLSSIKLLVFDSTVDLELALDRGGGGGGPSLRDEILVMESLRDADLRRASDNELERPCEFDTVLDIEDDLEEPCRCVGFIGTTGFVL